MPNDDAVLTVSEALSLAKGVVGQLPRMVIEGEVTGYTRPWGPGHLFFSLKDEEGLVACKMWAGPAKALDFDLKDGLKIRLRGSFDVHQKKGELAFIATSAEAAGEGILRQRVAALAKKLEREGLMDPSRKRPIPKFCQHVAVVTAPTGRVIHDVHRTLWRRNPLVQIEDFPCMVQGEAAPPTMIAALEAAAATHPEAILLVRGGGSYEDLMCFNDEALARAVAACPVPVISGVGHEPDVVITDMVADRRVSTPTAAAESVAPAIDEIERAINDRESRLVNQMSSLLEADSTALAGLARQMGQAMGSSLALRRTNLEALGQRRCLTDPASMVTDRVNELNDAEMRLFAALPANIARNGQVLDALAERMGAAAPRAVASARDALSRDARQLEGAATRMLRPYQNAVAHSAATLDALSPLKVLARGYAITRGPDGHVVKEAAQLAPGDDLTVLLDEGSVKATVTSVDEGAANQQMMPAAAGGRE